MLALGEPGWLSQLSGRLLISAQVTISGSRDWALWWVPHSAGSLLEASLPLPLPPNSHSRARALALSQINLFLKKNAYSVPGTIQSILHTLTHLILTTDLYVLQVSTFSSRVGILSQTALPSFPVLFTTMLGCLLLNVRHGCMMEEDEQGRCKGLSDLRNAWLMEECLRGSQVPLLFYFEA